MASAPLQAELHEIVGYYLFQPLAHLIDEIERASSEEPHVYPPVFLESAYGAAIIPIGIIILESFIRFAQLKEGKADPDRPLTTVIRVDFGRDDLADKLEEMLSVRNAIAHSHMWVRQISTYLEGGLRSEVGEFEPHGGYGDKMFRRVLDPDDPTRTRHLRLPVIPTRLLKADVSRFLVAMIEILEMLEDTLIERLGDERGKPMNIRAQRVQFREEFLPFQEVVTRLGR